MKIQLTHSKSSRDRYYLMEGKMGCAGEPPNHANNHFEIANGIDRGNGYQGYMAVSYFLREMSHVPQSAKNKVIQILKEKHLIY
jgi:hypothetical protein